jgi:hypothetical protein
VVVGGCEVIGGEAGAVEDVENGGGVGGEEAGAPGGVEFDDGPAPVVDEADIDDERGGKWRCGWEGEAAADIEDCGRERGYRVGAVVERPAEAEVRGGGDDVSFEDETSVFAEPFDRVGNEDGGCRGKGAAESDVVAGVVDARVETFGQGIGGFDELGRGGWGELVPMAEVDAPQKERGRQARQEIQGWFEEGEVVSAGDVLGVEGAAVEGDCSVAEVGVGVEVFHGPAAGECGAAEVRGGGEVGGREQERCPFS